MKMNGLMKTIKLLLLAGFGLLGSTVALAQTDDKYLDDAYYRRSDLKKIDKEAKRQAELRRAAERAEAEAWAKEQEKLIAAYKKKQADREIDAYNGHLALPEDTIQLTRSELGRLLKEQRLQGRNEVYGQYSSRLNRFSGDGRLVLGGASRIYIDADPWYDDIDYRYSGSDVYLRVGSRDPYWSSRWGWNVGWGWGSWYDPYYRYGWSYSPYYWGGWGSRYYDPFYYGGYYNGYWGARYGGYYGDYYGGYYGYPYSYHHYPRNYYSGYTGYRAVRNQMTITPPRPLDGNSSTGRSYDRDATQAERWNQTERAINRSYESLPQRSYDRSATESQNNSNSGGGYRTPARRR